MAAQRTYVLDNIFAEKTLHFAISKRGMLNKRAKRR